MSQSQILIKHLKKVIKKEGYTYHDIAKGLDCSLSNVKRMFSEERMTLDRFEAICRCLKLDFFDVIVQARSEESVGPAPLSRRQEELLADDRAMFIYYYLLARDWVPRRIQGKFKVSTDSHEKILLDLEKEGFLDYFPGGKVKLRVEKKLSWRPGSPIYEKLGPRISQEFFASSFDDHSSYIRFVTGEASQQSLANIRKRLEQFARDIQSLVEFDASLPKNETTSFGLVAGFRPWVFTVLRDWDGKSRQPIT